MTARGVTITMAMTMKMTMAMIIMMMMMIIIIKTIAWVDRVALGAPLAAVAEAHGKQSNSCWQ